MASRYRPGMMGMMGMMATGSGGLSTLGMHMTGRVTT